jgi:NAD(P)H dehydrogenase (quinone)
MSNKKILITGATGATGSSAIETLLGLNIPVRALVHKRDARSDQLSAKGARRLFKAISRTLKQSAKR